MLCAETNESFMSNLAQDEDICDSSGQQREQWELKKKIDTCIDL